MNKLIHIKTGHENKTTAELLRAGVDVLAGVTEAQQKALEQVGIRTVFDLALSPIFKIAHELQAAANDPRHPLTRFGLMPAGHVDGVPSGVTPGELIDDSTERLAGVDTAAAKELLSAAGIATIRDMALWPPYAAARLIADLCLQSDEEGQYTAPEIVPKFGEYATDIVYYPKLITISGPDDATTELDAPIDIMAAPTAGGSKPYLGARLTFQQCWTPEAVTLGQLLHSLTLAPGESTKMAVIDWTRKSRSSSQEDVSQTEALRSSFDQNSSLAEVTSAVATEIQGGMSASASTSVTATAATAAAAWSPVAAGAAATGVAATASAATSVSASAGRTDMASDYGQQIDSSTVQASVSERSKRAAMVTETSQSEHEELSTRVIVNYNHMHTLNILYFEVVQLYRVQLKLDKVERVLFVPMQEFKFDEKVIERFRHILIQAALGPDVRSWLQNRNGSVTGVLQAQSAPKLAQVLALLDAKPADKSERIQRAKDSAKAAVNIKAMLRSARSIPGAVSASNGDDTEWEFSGDCTLLHVGWDTGGSRISSVEIHTETGLSIEVRTNAGMRASSVIAARELAPGLPAADLASISLKVTSADVPRIQRVSLYFITTTGRVFEMPCDFVLPAKETEVQLVSFSSEQQLNQLARHLNENTLYYSQHIWRRLDAQTLGLVLAPFKFQGKRLIEYADTTPIAVSGRHLAFLFPDDSDSKWIDWKTKRLGKPYVSNRLVALPTGGVFAEGVLGRSNCAEKLDLTRFWNWQDSPPPIQAPDIAALQAGQHTVDSAPRAGGLEPSVVNIMNPQQLPDPTGVGAILGAMANGSMFRDMSGLAGTQALVNSGMLTSSALAGQSLSTVAGLTGAVAPLGLAGAGGAAGSGRGSAGGGGNRGAGGAAGFAPGLNPASNIAKGVERRLGALTGNPTAIGAGINLAREMDRTASNNAPRTGPAIGGKSSLPSHEDAFFRSNFSDSDADSSAFFKATGSNSEDVKLAGLFALGNDTLPSNIEDWRALFVHRVPAAIEAELEARNLVVQGFDFASEPIEITESPLNLDYYPVRVRKLPVKSTGTPYTLSEIHQEVRSRFPDLISTLQLTKEPHPFYFGRVVSGSSTPAQELMELARMVSLHSSFGPLDDQIDLAVWESTSPLGAVMMFHTFPDDMGVVASAVEADHWIFSTISDTDLGRLPLFGAIGTHPVTGHRQFGATANPDGTLTLYTRGVDRTTGKVETLLNDFVFFGGHLLWLAYQIGLRRVITELGGVAEIEQPFSQRFNYGAVLQHFANGQII
jgi:hypothetical protein